MSGKTGQATAGELAYDAYRKAAQNGIDEYWGWFSLTDQQRGAWETAAAAVETDQLRLAREDRDQLRKRVLDLAAALEAEGAEETAIARKRQGPADETDKNRGRVFKLCASRIRKIAGPPS